MKKWVVNIVIPCFAIMSMTNLWGCKESDSHTLLVDISRFELDIEQYAQLDELNQKSFNAAYNALLPFYNTTAFTANVCDSICHTRIFSMFRDDVKSHFPTLDFLKKSIGSARYKHESLFPNEQFPRIVTSILPYNQSIISCDSVYIIALNHYLGASHPMYECYEQYIRVQKEKHMIPVHFVSLLVSNRLGNLDKIKRSSLLDFIILEGIKLALKEALLPQYSLDTILGWNPSQLTWVKENQRTMWKHLIASDLLYSTSPINVSNLLRPMNYCPIFGTECPSQVGRWIGYQIVKSYIDSNNKSIENNYNEILNTQSQTILINSGYNGK